MRMINYTPDAPVGGAISPTAPVNEILGDRPLIVETYSRVGVLGRRHYWRVRHTDNKEIMGSGEAYSDPRDRDHAVDVLWPDLSVDPLG